METYISKEFEEGKKVWVLREDGFYRGQIKRLD